MKARAKTWKLIAVGTDVNAKNDSSFTPLRIAKLFEHARKRPRF